ncbi:transferase [Tamlana fucoidanivorans]|uniref:Transferase n=2 Tax=Allotamlana fucoidanivorans TaxID=2583814 RepID=A0A5C4SIN0_9FLAO|nr:transferase [Tamlana fucoidanivorans]
MLPFKTAKKLPVFFYGNVKFTSLLGSVEIDAEIKPAMIGFGQPYEMTTRSMGIAEIFLEGKVRFNGNVCLGKDMFFYTAKNALLEIGHMSTIASSSKIICTNKIIIMEWVQIGSESQIIDTNFHSMKNTLTQEVYPKTGEIKLGSYNYMGNRVSIMQNTITPNYFTVASNSLCNKDYTTLGSNTMVGGYPAKLIKENISRDWEDECERLEQHLTVKL